MLAHHVGQVGIVGRRVRHVELIAEDQPQHTVLKSPSRTLDWGSSVLFCPTSSVRAGKGLCVPISSKGADFL